MELKLQDKNQYKHQLTTPNICINTRPYVKGKFIYVGDDKLYIKGVTYGTFSREKYGSDYHKRDIVERDFNLMIENGINSVRTYTVPPPWFLDLAKNYNLYVMVGLPGTHSTAFLDNKELVKNSFQSVKNELRSCFNHPAVLCYSIANEIPGSIVRWHGRKKIEKYIKNLYNLVKDEDPQSIVTYVNYPTTEYLDLSFLDLICFNVYLESEDRLIAYLQQIQNKYYDKPLFLGEIGLDSRRNGKDCQASSIDWQIRTAFRTGCAGTYVFSWTDEWNREGYEIEDWDFGLTTRTRQFKPSLKAVNNAYSEVPYSNSIEWPTISVVVCTYNGNKTIPETLESLVKLDYPDFEIIVVNDGSNDGTCEILESYRKNYNFKVITSMNQGLSSARNRGIEAASGEIVTFIDDDAYPDPHWLKYIAYSFTTTKHVGIGGPNLCPDSDGNIAKCVSKSPGGPVHVLITDEEAEHIPGCNMAFRKSALKAIGGFDEKFSIAGDDVDICWKIQESGWTIGFNPSAIVWHHRRNSVRAYWKQQLNYGRAEALLEKKWPQKYNQLGHYDWTGRIYGNGNGTLPFITKRNRIYHGVWGSAAYQRLYESKPDILQSVLHIPEWYLIILVLFLLSTLGFFWTPLLFSLPLFILALGAPLAQSIVCSVNASMSYKKKSHFEAIKMHIIIATLNLIQPIARLFGRFSCGLTMWRRHGGNKLSIPWLRTNSIWNENWQAPEKILEYIEGSLRSRGIVTSRGNEYDNWDIEIRGGLFGAVRMRMAVEDHSGGKQMIKIRSWPKFSKMGFVLTLFFMVLTTLAAVDQAWYVYVVLGSTAALTAVRSLGDCAVATASFLKAIKSKKEDWSHV